MVKSDAFVIYIKIFLIFVMRIIVKVLSFVIKYFMKKVNLMEEFINEFGKENFYIMIAIVVIILFALFLILLFEKRNARKIMREQIANIKNNQTFNKKKTLMHSEDDENHNESEDFLEDPSQQEVSSNTNEEIYYVENKDTREEAKEKLEEVTKRLIDEQESSSLIDHTHFEEEQEEKSIISYDELIKASYDIDEKNDKLLADEGEAAITIEELYKKYEDDQNVIEEDHSSKNIKTNNPVFEDEHKKFKNSDVISPVFGVYSGKDKPQNDVLKELNKNVEQADLEDEIQRTEDFLKELKRLKNKLD